MDSLPNKLLNTYDYIHPTFTVLNDTNNIGTPKCLFNDSNYLIWIGHSTFLIKKDGLTVLTDPVFSDRASPFKRFGPKRLIPPSLSIKDLPPIDIVTVSHNHYDHLDIRSLKKISKKYPKALFLIPKGDKDIFNKRNIKNVIEFEWWQNTDFKNHTFTFENCSKLYFDIVWMFDFEDLPQAFKDYVTAKATRVAAVRMVSSTEAAKLLEADEAYARALALEYDARQGDHNIFNDFQYQQDANTVYRPFKVLRRM